MLETTLEGESPVMKKKIFYIVERNMSNFVRIPGDLPRTLNQSYIPIVN